MMIGALSHASLAALAATRSFASQKSDLDTLQGQLSTGKKATTYAGLGSSASRSLALNATLSQLDGSAANASDATNRLSLMSAGVTQISQMATALAPGLATTATGITASSTVPASLSDLQTTIDVLNSDYGGRYLFSGAASDTEPVASSDLILNGDATRAGLKTLIAERGAADLGTAGTGRLTASASGSTATVSEESPAQPFGMNVAGAASTGPAITATRNAGPPATLSFAVGSQPQAGDAVTATLTLPDGSTTTLTLTAAASAGAAGTFAIGATTADTASNLSAALTAALQTTATTTLAAASALRTTTDYFASSSSNPPARVAGPPFADATAVKAGTAADTVIWYAGDDRAGDPRQTAVVPLGDQGSVAIGARANELAFRSVLTGFAAMAASSFDSTDPTSGARYTALASRVSSLLSPSDSQGTVAGVAADLSLANATVSNATTAITGRKAQLQDALSGIEDADPTEVATKLMAAQTRLSASYQATATIMKLSLADYL